MTSDHVLRNRRAWDEMAERFEAPGARGWENDNPRWGVWGVPEPEVGLLDDVAGKDLVELGCGTAYVSSWAMRRGARPVGIDNSLKQLANAQRFQEHHRLPFPLIFADAERLPLKDESFDLAVTEYGASIWCDPYRWVPEAARVLRPGGELRFLVNGTILMMCVPDEEGDPAGTELIRPYFGMHRFEWPGDGSVEFHIGYGDWIRLLRANGLEVLDLLELRPAEGSTTSYPEATLDWARSWPAEEVWKARKRD
jgi:SAM-dependent methyltransferase